MGTAVDFNEYFPTEPEARLAHRLWVLCLHGWRGAEIPFPSRRQNGTKHRSGRRGSDSFRGIKAIVRLEDFVSRFTELRTSGIDKVNGCCPLYEERTPSFVVYLDQQTWYCYGACASGGDLITLAQRLIDKGRY